MREILVSLQELAMGAQRFIFITHQIHLRFSTLLNCEYKGLFDTSCWVGKGKEGLVGSLRFLAIDGCELEFERVCSTQ